MPTLFSCSIQIEAAAPTSTSTPIQWKEGKNILEQHQASKQKQGRKRSSDVRTFFEWFTNNNDPACDEIAELIKDDLWPNPLQYYLVPGDGEDIEGEEDLGEEELGDEEELAEEEEDDEK